MRVVYMCVGYVCMCGWVLAPVCMSTMVGEGSSVSLCHCLIFWSQSLSLNLELSWLSASPREPPASATHSTELLILLPLASQVPGLQVRAIKHSVFSSIVGTELEGLLHE